VRREIIKNLDARIVGLFLIHCFVRYQMVEG